MIFFAAISTPWLHGAVFITVAAFWLLIFGYVLWFFRDPERTSPPSSTEIVAAADGVVVEIEDMEETEVTQQRMRRVAIFLSVFNVHTNRAPIAGEVTYLKHFPGTYLDARDPECSKKNEAQTWAFKNERSTLVVRQITGAIARRIVAWSKVGDRVEKGERFGMIRFGSRTEVYLPLDCEIVTKIGDKVAGGATVIARFPKA
ncbi:MAG: phosphatidylserine decarboxylase family protein [Chthoniobacteraceae bacterium]